MNSERGDINGTTRAPRIDDVPIMNVKPPRREDLQPSYAQTLVGESDASAHGWYGNMSELIMLSQFQGGD